MKVLTPGLWGRKSELQGVRGLRVQLDS